MKDMWMGRDAKYPPTTEMKHNMRELHYRVTKLLRALNKKLRLDPDIVVSSGYRPAEFNRIKNAATMSRHMTARAVDLVDVDGAIAQALLKDWESSMKGSILADCRLWMEHPDHTKGWVHLDIGMRRGLACGVFHP